LLPDARRLFSPDPSDTFRMPRARGETPARALSLSVLMQAFVDLRRAPRDQKHGKARNLYTETRAWFLSDDRGGPHTFCSICETFGWSPEAVRQAILRNAGPEPVQLRLVRRR
jgi:hypothetical protein